MTTKIVLVALLAAGATPALASHGGGSVTGGADFSDGASVEILDADENGLDWARIDAPWTDRVRLARIEGLHAGEVRAGKQMDRLVVVGTDPDALGDRLALLGTDGEGRLSLGYDVYAFDAALDAAGGAYALVSSAGTQLVLLQHAGAAPNPWTVVASAPDPGCGDVAMVLTSGGGLAALCGSRPLVLSTAGLTVGAELMPGAYRVSGVPEGGGAVFFAAVGNAGTATLSRIAFDGSTWTVESLPALPFDPSHIAAASRRAAVFEGAIGASTDRLLVVSSAGSWGAEEIDPSFDYVYRLRAYGDPPRALAWTETRLYLYEKSGGTWTEVALGSIGERTPGSCRCALAPGASGAGSWWLLVLATSAALGCRRRARRTVDGERRILG